MAKLKSEEEEEWKPCPKRPLSFSSIPSSKRNRIQNAISVASFDLQVLDCSSCYQPLTIPVFQCKFGHTICRSCWENNVKCPSCYSHTCTSKLLRCRTMENVIQSVRVTCQNKIYGCEEKFTYSKKIDHDKNCLYTPCSCPISGCDFIASSFQINSHCLQRHTDSVLRFQYDCSFDVSVKVNAKFLVLQETNRGDVFLLANRAECSGNVITVCCIGPALSDRGYHYDIAAEVKGINHRFQSVTKNVESNDIDDLSLTGVLLGKSHHQFGAKGFIHLKLCIWSRDPCPRSFE